MCVCEHLRESGGVCVPLQLPSRGSYSGVSWILGTNRVTTTCRVQDLC